LVTNVPLNIKIASIIGFENSSSSITTPSREGAGGWVIDLSQTSFDRSSPERFLIVPASLPSTHNRAFAN
ncbi:MAG: hypothetical protein PHS75_06915, partial [Anaerolineaceae bacterium]|nr:hypothetical protein [Anaerolineaceae bacterium]